MAVDISKLGLRSVQQRELVSTKTREGVQNFKWQLVQREELSPLLTADEAKLLDGWEQQPDGMWMTTAEGPDGRRRFFCEVKPDTGRKETSPGVDEGAEERDGSDTPEKKDKRKARRNSKSNSK